MKERDKIINHTRQKRSERILRRSLSEQERELELENERKKKYSIAAQASFGNINDLGRPTSWREIEEQEDMKRRERVEMRKLELSSKVSYPSHEIEQSVEHWKYKLQENGIAINQYVADITGRPKRFESPQQVY